MSFDLKKAMANRGKCIVNYIGEKVDGVIVCDNYRVDNKDALLVVHTIDDKSYTSIIGGDGRVHYGPVGLFLENIPETYDVHIAITSSGDARTVHPFNYKSSFLKFLDRADVTVRSTGKITLTDGEFISGLD